MATHQGKVLKFWNDRARFGQNAGTNDFMLKILEERVLLEHIPEGSEVLDIGCGNGSTLIRLVKEKRCQGVGLDYAENLLELANKNAIEQGLQKNISFRKQDIRNLRSELGTHQNIFTQRCLINLESLEEQEKAFGSILHLLPSGGRYYMIEAFNDGNQALNDLRQPLGLELMTTPWHNLFFNLGEVYQWEKRHPVKLQTVIHFASTFYFLI